MSDLLRYLAALGFMRQRGLIVCQCDREKSFDYLAQMSQGCAVAVLTDSASVSALRAQHIKAFTAQTLRTQLLGDEFDLLLIDVAAGLPPDGLALTAGALRGGGVCILLFDQSYCEWPTQACADYARMLPYPYTQSQSHYRFLSHIKRVLDKLINAQQVLFMDDVVRLPNRVYGLPKTLGFTASALQQTAVSSLENHRGLALISGPRGAGKSSALGLLADALQQKQRAVILLAATAAGRSAVQRTALQPIETQTLEQLLALPLLTRDQQQQNNDTVLLIDESAALPVAVIDALCARFTTVMMASTTEGYEGSGQALTVKLMARWRKRDDFIHVLLAQSLRFTEPDPLSQFLQQGLLLDVEPASSTDNGIRQWRYLSQAQLLSDTELLEQIYALLRSAHYRTTPDDLRVLLDGVDTHCAVMFGGQSVLAVCLWVVEGGLDVAISAEIAAGRRRPRGHLLVQSMAQHLGDASFLTQRVARVMRIAVSEPLRRQGLASHCLNGVEQWLRAQHIAWIGSSFSASDEAMGFWLANGYQLQRIGHRRHPASGELSALVLKALN